MPLRAGTRPNVRHVGDRRQAGGPDRGATQTRPRQLTHHDDGLSATVPTPGEALALWLSVIADATRPPTSAVAEQPTPLISSAPRPPLSTPLWEAFEVTESVTVARSYQVIGGQAAPVTIDAVDGTPVGNSDQFTALLKNTKPGQR